MNKSLPIVILLVAIMLSASILAPSFAKSKASKKAQKDIIKKIDKATEGKWQNIVVLNITKKGTPGIIVVVNKTTGPVIPIPVPCLPDQHIENGVCVPNPQPTGNNTIMCTVGDISGSSVSNAMNKAGCKTKIALGDLGYQSTLSDFKKLGFTKCVIGNHEALEDGSASLLKEAKAYCGESWWNKLGEHVLLLGFNTNGNLDEQLGSAQGIVMDPSIMQGVKTVYAFSHKGGSVPPNSHHAAEPDVATLLNSLQSSLPGGVIFIQENAHNHVMAKAPDMFVSGGGGRSHYDCGTNAVWKFCNNTVYGFHMWTIDLGTGIGTEKFIDTTGKEILK